VTNASQHSDSGESPPLSPFPLHLSLMPDTDEDIAMEAHLPTMMRMLARTASEVPSRVLHPCMACMQPCLYLIGRDFNNPNLIFGGAICSNLDCSVCSISVVEDEPDGE